MAKNPEFGRDKADNKADLTPLRGEGTTLTPRTDYSDNAVPGPAYYARDTEAKSVSSHDVRSQPGIMAAASDEQRRNVGATDVPREGDHRPADGSHFAAVPSTQPMPTPAHMRAPGAPATPNGDAPLEGIKKGDLVRLLVPHHDGFQLLAADSVVHWWNDEPPSSRYVAYADSVATPLDAPAMTDGKPPEHYLDPNTGKKPVVGSV